VVLCNPLGYEAICAYRTYCHLAEGLAAAGFPVLRFDYHGTGDSSGQDDDPDRVRAWLDSITAAGREVMARSRKSEVSFFGTRMGGTLAAMAAAELGGVSRLMLWAPCSSGRAYVREMRASQLIRRTGRSPESAAASLADGDVEAAGFLLTRQTVEALSALEVTKIEAPLAHRLLVLARGDLPTEERLAAQLEAHGNRTTYRNVPGFSEMMVDQVHRSVVPGAVIAAAIAWMADGEPDGELEGGTDRETDDEPPAAPGLAAGPAALGRTTDGGVTPPELLGSTPEGTWFREEPVVFGEAPRLFGILTEPRGGVGVHAGAGVGAGTAGDEPGVRAPSVSGRPAVLMLNVGTNHRVGPNRLYVKMARTWAAMGYAVLRFDLAGIGDSRAAEGYAQSRLYSKDAIADVQAAMAFLERFRRIDRFVLVGLCSGAYVAFHTALADPRVVGEVLINTATFSWKPGDPIDVATQRVYKSSHFYRRALFDIDTWRRAARGQIDLRGIASRLQVLAVAKVKARLATTAFGRPPGEEGLAAAFKKLSRRGTDSLLIYGEEDQGLDSLELELGPKAGKLRALPNFRVDVIPGPDHTFTQLWAQRRLIDAVTSHLGRRFA
jgi:alpha-beta hydrolase superfamily lysophospholipase